MQFNSLLFMCRVNSYKANNNNNNNARSSFLGCLPPLSDLLTWILHAYSPPPFVLHTPILPSSTDQHITYGGELQLWITSIGYWRWRKVITIRIRFLDYIHRPSVLMKFTTFRRLLCLRLQVKKGQGRKGGLVCTCTKIDKVKVNKVKIGINCQSYTVRSLRMS
jgi:hypothetical protein